MMELIRYSVIIPAYNAEKTISRCLDSLLPQLPEDAEIILVDDGSEDQTHAIVEEYARECSQLHVIAQLHGGVSAARNKGLDLAKGIYVLFVDSDDAVTSDYFFQIRKATESEPDLVLFHQENGWQKNQSGRLSAEPEELQNTIRATLRQQLLNSPWAKAFRRSIIAEHHLRFDERLSIGEDKVFVVQFSLLVNSIYNCNTQIYLAYTDNMESLSRKTRVHLEEEILLEHQRLFDAAINADDIGVTQEVTYSYFRSAYTVIRELRKLPLNRQERLKQTKSICEEYCKETRIRFGRLTDWMIALPIRLKLSRMIDLFLQVKR